MPDLVAWRKMLSSRKKRLAKARKKNKRRTTPELRREIRQLRELVARAQSVVERYAKPGKLVLFDGTPVPRGLARVLKDARQNGGWRGSLTSAFRGPGVRKFGKKSQADLYNGWVRRLPGYNPANPPGRSTHECRSDGSYSMQNLGAAYRGKSAGAKLKWWQCGLDVSDSQGLLNALHKLGYSAARTYPDPREYHHINFRKNPLRRWRKRHAKGKASA